MRKTITTRTPSPSPSSSKLPSSVLPYTTTYSVLAHRQREGERDRRDTCSKKQETRKRMCWDDHHHGLKINQTSCYGRLTCSLLETEQNFSSWKNSLPFCEEERKKT
jgi:hypothetical protein